MDSTALLLLCKHLKTCLIRNDNILSQFILLVAGPPLLFHLHLWQKQHLWQKHFYCWQNSLLRTIFICEKRFPFARKNSVCYMDNNILLNCTVLNRTVLVCCDLFRPTLFSNALVFCTFSSFLWLSFYGFGGHILLKCLC